MVILGDIFPDSQWLKRRDNIRNLVCCLCFPKLSMLLAFYNKGYLRRFDVTKMQFYARLALASGIILTCITIFGWVAFPNLIRSKIKSVSLSEMCALWCQRNVSVFWCFVLIRCFEGRFWCVNLDFLTEFNKHKILLWNIIAHTKNRYTN